MTPPEGNYCHYFIPRLSHLPTCLYFIALARSTFSLPFLPSKILRSFPTLSQRYNSSWNPPWILGWRERSLWVHQSQPGRPQVHCSCLPTTCLSLHNELLWATMSSRHLCPQCPGQPPPQWAFVGSPRPPIQSLLPLPFLTFLLPTYSSALHPDISSENLYHIPTSDLTGKIVQQHRKRLSLSVAAHELDNVLTHPATFWEGRDCLFGFTIELPEPSTVPGT